MITISESNMNFGPFEEDCVFYIEKSHLYQNICYGVQMAEFILKKDKNLIFIEAKSSSPKQLKKDDGSPCDFIVEVSDKLTNALELFISANLKIANDSKEEANNLIDFNSISEYSIKFRLVINGHKKEWLTNIQDALEKNLKSYSKIWNIEVKVLNDETARQYKLIS